MNTQALLEQVTLGSFFGDGWFFKPKSDNANSYLDIQHYTPQGPYLHWKADVFEKVGTPVHRKETPKKENTIAYRMATKCDPFFSSYRRSGYYKGKKFVTRHMLNKLDALGLAIWFMDDGHFSCFQSDRKGYLHTEGFGYNGNEICQKYFLERWNIKSRIWKDSKGYFCLVFEANAFRALRNIILPYIHPSMSYKIDMKYKEVPMDYLSQAQAYHNAEYPEIAFRGNDIV